MQSPAQICSKARQPSRRGEPAINPRTHRFGESTISRAPNCLRRKQHHRRANRPRQRRDAHENLDERSLVQHDAADAEAEPLLVVQPPEPQLEGVQSFMELQMTHAVAHRLVVEGGLKIVASRAHASQRQYEQQRRSRRG